MSAIRSHARREFAAAVLVVLAAIVLLLLCGGIGLAEDGAVIGRVLVSDRLDSRLMRQELARFEPTLELERYSGKSVERDPSRDVVVVYMEDAPADFREKGALAAAVYGKRMIYVFVRDLERYLSINKGDPRFRIALGRILAHELEHVRRQRPGHDAQGYFKACLSKDEMLALGWGAEWARR